MYPPAKLIAAQIAILNTKENATPKFTAAPLLANGS
jgi:hypothetical protein